MCLPILAFSSAVKCLWRRQWDAPARWVATFFSSLKRAHVAQLNDICSQYRRFFWALNASKFHLRLGLPGVPNWWGTPPPCSAFGLELSAPIKTCYCLRRCVKCLCNVVHRYRQLHAQFGFKFMLNHCPLIGTTESLTNLHAPDSKCFNRHLFHSRRRSLV